MARSYCGHRPGSLTRAQVPWGTKTWAGGRKARWEVRAVRLWQELEHLWSRGWEGTAVHICSIWIPGRHELQWCGALIALISSISLLPAAAMQFQSTDCSRKGTFILQWLTEKLCFPPRRKLLHNYCKCKYLFLLSPLAYDLTYAFGEMLSSSHASGSHVHPICFIPKYLNLLCL